MESKKTSQNAGNNSIQINEANKVVISHDAKPIPTKVVEKQRTITYISPDVEPPSPSSTPPPASNSSDETTIGCMGLMLIITCIVIGYFLFKPKPAKVLEPIKTYTFEKGLPDNLGLLGNSSLSIESPGFSGDKSLRVNLLLSPEVQGSNRGGFFINLPDKPNVKAISMFVYLPETSMSTSEPIYMNIIAISSLDKKLGRLCP